MAVNLAEIAQEVKCTDFGGLPTSWWNWGRRDTAAAMSQHPEGWYYDESSGLERWWDGLRWTDNTRPVQRPTPPPTGPDEPLIDPLATGGARSAGTRPCPMCKEEIRVDALKCKHCGEFLDGRPPSPAVEGMRQLVLMACFIVVGLFLQFVVTIDVYGEQRHLIPGVAIVLGYIPAAGLLAWFLLKRRG